MHAYPQLRELRIQYVQYAHGSISVYFICTVRNDNTEVDTRVDWFKADSEVKQNTCMYVILKVARATGKMQTVKTKHNRSLCIDVHKAFGLAGS